MIDLERQLLELFNKERMLAFFDFQVRIGESEPYSGLCKISQPKGGGSQSRYLSLLFLIDTPSDTAWQQVDGYVKAVNWNTFEGELPGVTTVLPIPHLHGGTGLYFKEVDLYLKSTVTVMRHFVMNRLYPAILRVMKVDGGEVVFWDDVPETRQTLKGFALNREPDRSVVDRLKDFFGL